MHANFHSLYYRRLAGGCGVFALLFICEYIASFLFGKEKETRQWKVGGARIVSYVSYASMACYMFHRLFFWVGEKLFNSEDVNIKWIYMAGVVFPLMLYLSYLIQKYYDKLVQKV